MHHLIFEINFLTHFVTLSLIYLLHNYRYLITKHATMLLIHLFYSVCIYIEQYMLLCSVYPSHTCIVLKQKHGTYYLRGSPHRGR